MLEDATYICVRPCDCTIAFSDTPNDRYDSTSRNESLPLNATPLASSTINKRRGTSTIISCWVFLLPEVCQHEKANGPKSNGITCAFIVFARSNEIEKGQKLNYE